MITAGMSILEVLERWPETRGIFKRHGMSCLECMGAETETLGEGARAHGINLAALLDDLNAEVACRELNSNTE